jgi:exodeoxyribonuclease V alpha subunit
MPAATPEPRLPASQRLVAELFGAAEAPALARLAAARAAGDTGVPVDDAEAAVLIAAGLAGRAEAEPVQPFVVLDAAQAAAPPASSLQPPAAARVPRAAWLCDRRTWTHERDLARALTARAARAMPADPMPAPSAIDAAFPDHPAARAVGGVDWQRRAAETALERGLTLITGGPGSGKTTVAARIVALLAQAAQAAGRTQPVVVLAAPTGKAAARLAEAVREGLRGMGLDPAVAAALAGWSSTLHRLFHDRRVADIDLAVIDEASMADAASLDRVLARLPQRTRVLLLGDPDQLASVEPGRVLGDLAALPPAHPIAAASVRLRINWRSGRAPALAALVQDLQEGGFAADRLLEAGPAAEGASWIWRQDQPATPERTVDALLDAHAAWFASLRDAGDPAAALRAAAEMRLLAVLRAGPWGTDRLNALWEDGLRARGLVEAGRDFHGRLILLTRNRHDLGLANGDVGVCWRDSDGALRARFADLAGTRAVPLHRLDATEPAWFLTVHKAQGGQGDQVEVIGLPPDASEGQRRLATREMVYTAITRASARLRVWWDAAGLRDALARRELDRRRSGFAVHLRRAAP